VYGLAWAFDAYLRRRWNEPGISEVVTQNRELAISTAVGIAWAGLLFGAIADGVDGFSEVWFVLVIASTLALAWRAGRRHRVARS